MQLDDDDRRDVVDGVAVVASLAGDDSAYVTGGMSLQAPAGGPPPVERPRWGRPGV